MLSTRLAQSEATHVETSEIPSTRIVPEIQSPIRKHFPLQSEHGTGEAGTEMTNNI